MQFHRQQYLDLMTFGAPGRPMFVELFGPLVGLDRAAAKAAFAAFMEGRALTANQIEFLDLIIEHLTERGQMDPRLLYESPFTDFDPMGVTGVFGDAAPAIVAVLAEVKRRAAAA